MSSLKFAGIHLPSRDLGASEAFYVDVLGAELIASDGMGFRVRIGDFEIAVARQAGGGTPPGCEYPHYALTVTPEQFVGLKRRIDAFGVPTNEPWTRVNRRYALMYFRDPSDNQFELFAPDGAGDYPLKVGAKSGGDYATDFHALSYRTIVPPVPGTTIPDARAGGFNHLTVPCRDLADAKRFLVEVLGGTVSYEARTHVTAVIGGAEIGVAPQDGGWTGPKDRYPHLAFEADLPDALTLRERLSTCGVPTALATAGADGFVYFRDPAGYLWKLVSRNAGAALRATTSCPDDEQVDVGALGYTRWSAPAPIEAT